MLKRHRQWKTMWDSTERVRKDLCMSRDVITPSFIIIKALQGETGNEIYCCCGVGGWDSESNIIFNAAAFVAKVVRLSRSLFESFITSSSLIHTCRFITTFMYSLVRWSRIGCGALGFRFNKSLSLPLAMRERKEEVSNEIHNFTTFSLKKFNVRLKTSLAVSKLFLHFKDSVTEQRRQQVFVPSPVWLAFSSLRSHKNRNEQEKEREGGNFEGIILSILFLSNLIAFLSCYHCHRNLFSRYWKRDWNWFRSLSEQLKYLKGKLFSLLLAD